MREITSESEARKPHEKSNSQESHSSNLLKLSSGNVKAKTKILLKVGSSKERNFCGKKSSLEAKC